jgi:hypothetical protein
MPLSNAYRAKWVDSTLRAVAFSAPSTVYIALFTADPTADCITGNEVQTGSHAWYARQSMAFAAQGTPGITSNSAAVTFAVVTGTDTTATHYALFDASTSGTMISYGALSSSKTYSAGDVPSFLAGQLAITLT